MKQLNILNSKLFKDKASRVVICGIAIFAFGIFVGCQLDNWSAVPGRGTAEAIIS